MVDKIKTIKDISTESIIVEIQKYIESGIPYIDAVVEYAEVNEIEIEVLGEMIKNSPLLKAQIQYEAEELNMLEAIPRLPV
jgi:predicted aldo/keto reductase-like oxidoreductase